MNVLLNTEMNSHLCSAEAYTHSCSTFGSSSQMVCRLQGDFQLISCLRLRLEFMVLFQHDASDVIIQQIQIWRVWGILNPGQLIQYNIKLVTRHM